MSNASSLVRRRCLAAWLGGTALAAVTLVGVALSTTAVADAEKVITFGASISLTGRLAHEGRLVKDGYDFIIEHLDQHGGIPVGEERYQLHGIYYDDESDADTAARQVDRLLVEDEVDFLLGPYSSITTFPASTVAERFQVPMVVAHAAATPIYERGYRYLFATLPIIDQYFNAVLDMAVELEPRPETVAIINEDSMAPTLVLASAAARAEHHGIEIVYRENYPTGSLDVSSMLAAIREARPDMVLAGGYTSDFYGPVRFDEMGRNVGKTMAVVQVQDGWPVVVYPPDVATGEIIYPRPAR